MNINFWEPQREYVKHQSEILGAVNSCLSRGEIVLGYLEEIKTFEKDFAKFIGTDFGVMCGSGTQALHLAYRALGLKGNWNHLWQRLKKGEITLEQADALFEGDEVITTSHTFIATIDQIVAVGARPILVDIGEDGLIDPKKIQSAITPKTKAIVPVHLEGKIAQMDEITEIADEYELKIIEDAAQAIGAEYYSSSHQYPTKAGSMGEAGCFSLYPAKIFGSIGNAGFLATDDPVVAEKASLLRCNYNIGRKSKDVAGAEYGHNFEPDAIQAAVLNVKLPHLEARIKRRSEIAEQYDEAFKEYPIILPFKQKGRVYQDYVLRTNKPEQREEIVVYLRANGIGVIGDALIPNHFYQKLFLTSKLPNTERYLATQFRIPCNPDLTFEEIEYIIKTIQNYYDTK